MRWESEINFIKVAPAQIWSKRDEVNFGGRSILTPNQNELVHYGTPGMKWGIRAKEYVKKGYDTLARRRAAEKMKREAALKRQYDEGYRRGQRIASNTYFIKKQTSKLLSKKQRLSDKDKGDFIDRGIDKGFQKILDKTKLEETAKQYGLDDEKIAELKSKATDFIKDFKNGKVDSLLEWMRTPKGMASLQKATSFVSKQAFRAGNAAAKAASSTAPYVRRGISSIGRAALSGGKHALKSTAKATVSGYKWLRNGGVTKIKTGARSVESTISKAMNKGSDILKTGTNSAHIGIKSAHRNLNDLLAKRPRRRR